MNAHTKRVDFQETRRTAKSFIEIVHGGQLPHQLGQAVRIGEQKRQESLASGAKDTRTKATPHNGYNLNDIEISQWNINIISKREEC